jgi:hypothetical protein
MYLVLSMPPLHTTASRQAIVFRISPLTTPEVRHNICVFFWTSAGLHEHGNEPTASIKDREFLN